MKFYFSKKSIPVMIGKRKHLFASIYGVTFGRFFIGIVKEWA